MKENLHSSYSPMIRQYLEIKEQNKDMLLFYRVGDFYEMFFQDAIVASRELEIVLTSKDAGISERVPMCGVPHHAVSSYIQRLTNKGFKVGIVDQVEDPRLAKGIVKREVTRVVTPGTIIDSDSLSSNENNYLVSLTKTKEVYIISYLDLSTGEARVINVPLDEYLLLSELINLNTKEIVLDAEEMTKANLVNNELKNLQRLISFTVSYEENKILPSYFHNLAEDLNTFERETYGRIINYIIRTQMRTLVHLQKVIKLEYNNYLKIDYSSQRNLELLQTLRLQSRQNTLFTLLDKTKTAMGSRYLKQNILYPLVDESRIKERYDVIDKMKKHFIETAELSKALVEVYDLERIVGKVSYANVNPKDLIQLKKTLAVFPKIKNLIQKITINNVFDLASDEEIYVNLHIALEAQIDDDAPYVLKDGGIIKDGFSSELDELRSLNKSSKDYILAIEAKERERTGIKQLKIGFNKVFGYYIEVSKLNSTLIKDEYGYIRKQTLANAERYITQELKEKEALILHAEERAIALEIKIFEDLREDIKQYTLVLQKWAKVIAQLDMMQSLTRLANENSYVRPNITKNNKIEIIEGRHPVMENNMVKSFIPNDLIMDDELILLITGPNMSGKSTYMRQVALIIIMAQIGSFVPAKKASFPLFDQIFTRIGAADDIVSGQSTFMVEMMEVNFALTHASERSLILFDEIGRGTATYDGMALAQAIIEYVHNEIKAKTLFSTHYHELTSLEGELEHLKNVHVAAIEEKGELVFVHKVMKGPIDKSYGINVAKLAKMPLSLVLRAKDLLAKLQDKKNYDGKKLSLDNYHAPLIYDSKTDLEKDILTELTNFDITKITPLEALNYLDEIKRKLKK